MGSISIPPVNVGTKPPSIYAPFFPTANKKIAAVKGATGSMRVLCIGNSKVWGTTNAGGANPPGPGGTSWPSQMQALLNNLVAPSQIGFSIPQADNVNVPATDTRWVTAAGWSTGYGSYPLAQYGIGGAASWIGAVAASDMTFTPGNGSIDSFDVYYLLGPGLGTFKIAIDAASGGGTVVNSAQAGFAIGKTTITAAAGTVHVLHVGSVTVGAVAIVGIDAYLSTGTVIRIGNCGVVGNAAFQQADQLLNSLYGSLATIRAYAPDLTIIEQGGTIDGLFSFSPTQVMQSLAMIAAAASLSGDVILASETPTLPIYGSSLLGTTIALEAQIASLLPAFAQTNDYGMVDLYNMMQPLSVFQTQGYFNYSVSAADEFHLSPSGNAWVAYQMAKVFAQI